MKKKREKVKGRARAIVCMILLIVLSIPLGAGFSLMRERDAVRDHYYILIEDLADCRDEAVNMTTLAGKYMEADTKALEAVKEWNHQLGVSESPAEKAAAYTELTQSVNTLYNQLGEMDMTEADAEYREEIYADYMLYVDLISYSEYSVEAMKFNEKFLNSPAKTIGMLLGVKELELFA